MMVKATDSRRQWLAATCALGAVFALKLIVLSQLLDHPLLQPDAGLDTTAYVTLAKRVLNGDLAVTLFKRSTEAEPTRADAWAQLGFALLFSDRTADAERALQEAVRLRPADSVALGGLAVCAARLGRRDEALKRANAALAIDPADPLARQVRAALVGR